MKKFDKRLIIIGCIVSIMLCASFIISYAVVGGDNATAPDKIEGSGDVICPTATLPKTVVFNTNGGNSINNMVLKHPYSNSNPLPTPIRSGYVFEGWYYNAALTKKVTTTEAAKLTYTPQKNNGDCPTSLQVTLYAKWTPQQQSGGIVEYNCPIGGASRILVFNTNGGNQITNMGISAMPPGTFILPTPTKIGYTFEGWYYDSALTRKVPSNDGADIAYTPAQDEHGCSKAVYINLYAKWNSKPASTVEQETGTETNNNEISSKKECKTSFPYYEIVFQTNGGNKLENYDICNTCDHPTILPVPEKEGYVFEGWYYEKDLQTLLETTDPKEINYIQLYDENKCAEKTTINLYAKWNIAGYNLETHGNIITIVYNTNSVNELSSYTLYSNSDEKNYIETPKKSGHIFKGWYYDVELTKQVNVLYLEEIAEEANKLNQNVIINLYAKWEKLENTKEEQEQNKFDNILIIVGGIIAILFIISIMPSKPLKKEQPSSKEEGNKFFNQ